VGITRILAAHCCSNYLRSVMGLFESKVGMLTKVIFRGLDDYKFLLLKLQKLLHTARARGRVKGCEGHVAVQHLGEVA
jgi:hypothetical protein